MSPSKKSDLIMSPYCLKSDAQRKKHKFLSMQVSFPWYHWTLPVSLPVLTCAWIIFNYLGLPCTVTPRLCLCSLSAGMPFHTLHAWSPPAHLSHPAEDTPTAGTLCLHICVTKVFINSFFRTLSNTFSLFAHTSVPLLQSELPSS